jgi:hypothetical protein
MGILQIGFAIAFSSYKDHFTKGKPNKLYKTLVASVDEINGQPILHHPYTIVCHPYITLKIKHLHNDMCQRKRFGNFLF